MAGTLLFAISLTLPPGNLWHDLTESLAEALIISLIIAAVVDPYIKAKFTGDATTSAALNAISPNAPSDLKQAFAPLLRPRHYSKLTNWLVSFDWERSEEVLRVTVRAVTTGRILGPKKFSPLSGASFILGSTDGYESRLTYWRFQVFSSGIDEEKTERELAALCKRHPDGRVTLDERKLYGGLLEPETEYTKTKEGVMYRRTSGYLPLWTSTTTVRSRYTISGSALRDLDIEFLLRSDVIIPKQSQVESKVEISNNELLVPGTCALVTWRLREP